MIRLSNRNSDIAHKLQHLAANITVQVLHILPCGAVFVHKLCNSHIRVSDSVLDAIGHISSH